MVSSKLKNRLDAFGSKHHSVTVTVTDTDLFVISKAGNLLNAEPDFVAVLVAECEEVERSTWDKRFAVVQSTFELDYVALLFVGNQLVGFASLGIMRLSPAIFGLKFSEIMIPRCLVSKDILGSMFQCECVPP